MAAGIRFSINLFIMALLHNKCVKIKGISACVPKNVIRNVDNTQFASGDINAFISNVGVEELRMS